MSSTEQNRKVIITTDRIVTAVASFPGLDGFMKAVGEKPIIVPYKFTDETRKRLRLWKRALKVIADDYEEDRIAIVKELSPANEDVALEPLEVRKIFESRTKVLRDVRHTFDIPLLKQDGELLCDNKNPIPDTILEALDCICEEGAMLEEVAAAVKPEGGEPA